MFKPLNNNTIRIIRDHTLPSPSPSPSPSSSSLSTYLQRVSSRNIFNSSRSLRNKSLQFRNSSSSLCHLPKTSTNFSTFPSNNKTEPRNHELNMTSAPHPQVIPTQTLDNYTFPTDRLRLTQNDPEKTPLVLVACGSFSPITYLHLRMMEMAADYCKFNTEFELLSGYFSPVSNFYKKAGLASSEHRLNMCELAVQSSNWLMVDPWEALQTEYTPTALVLDHVEHEINKVMGGAIRPDGSRVPVRIALLAGADLIETMSIPGVWSEADLQHILGQYGTFIVERTGTDIEDALASLEQYKRNIYVIQQLVTNDISSTKIRLFLRKEMSVQYLLPAPVIKYIEEHHLYEEDGASSISAGKSKVAEGSGMASPAVGDAKLKN